MSQKSPQIGKCSICLSKIKISNIYAISKCGHTFHQKCILQWISSAKNCPTCRTNAIQSDIIRLFIQENNDEIVIPKKKEILPYIETKWDGCLLRTMKECKCKIFRDETGDLEYKCWKDFDIKICSYKKTGKIQILFPNEIIVTIYQSKRLEIIRGKTNDKSIVNPNGERFEFKTQNMGDFRSDEDFVRQNKNFIKFWFPEFTILRSLKNGENGKVTICVYTNGSNKSMKIQICPEHQSFFVEHLFEKKRTRCTTSGILLKKPQKEEELNGNVETGIQESDNNNNVAPDPRNEQPLGPGGEEEDDGWIEAKQPHFGSD
uniref:RING-type domain-containing protein n=1 Tax=Panagrolaimus davidi TaxID=227884 RepID=A0A914QQV2_9BILA